MTHCSKKRIILGIDPGTIITGYAILTSQQGMVSPLDFGVIKPSKKAYLSTRYLELSQAIRELIQRFQTTELAIETPFVNKNPQSALKLGGALSCALVAAREAGMEVFGYSPREIKKGIAGKGDASKEEIESIVQSHFRLTLIKRTLDATDALSLALYHALQPTLEEIQRTKIL